MIKDNGESFGRLARIERWTVVGTRGQARLFGLLRECNGQPEYRWILSDHLTSIDFIAHRASTEDNVSWELWSRLMVWGGDARSALRALADLEGLNVRDLDANALVRPGESLGGVSDQVWVRTHAMAHALRICPPKRDQECVRIFNLQHGASFLADRLDLLRERDRETAMARLDAKFAAWGRS